MADERRGRVLVVDGDADTRSQLVGVLEPHWSVASAADGAEGLALARGRPPDVLVTSEILTPALDGRSFVRELRQDPATSQLPVILLCAAVGEEMTPEGSEARADDYLRRPFSAGELL